MLDKPFVPKKVRDLMDYVGCGEQMATEFLKAVAMRSMVSEGECFKFQIGIAPKPAEAVTSSDEEADEPAPAPVPTPRPRKPKPPTIPVSEKGEPPTVKWQYVGAGTSPISMDYAQTLVVAYEKGAPGSKEATEAYDKLTDNGWERAA